MKTSRRKAEVKNHLHIPNLSSITHKAAAAEIIGTLE